MMRVWALVVWFDEPVELLERMLRSLDGFVDGVIALDGAYATFPHSGDGSSAPEQHAVFRDVCRELALDLVLPAGRVYASQADKRQHAFRLAQRHGTLFSDYTMIVDADEAIVGGDAAAFRARLLDGPQFETGMVWLDTLEPEQGEADRSLRGIHHPRNSSCVSGVGYRRVFRLLRDLRVGPRYHWTYVGLNELGGEVAVKGAGKFNHPTVARHADLTELVRIENLTWHRDPKRIDAKHAYGQARDALGIDL